MKGRHGTRMVHIITKEWMLQLILDEPPDALERAWRDERVQYYRRVEPTEAPRDTEPYLPPASKQAKALRLENEASDRMWQLLLRDDEINELKVATEHAARLKETKEAGEDTSIPSADEITDSLLKIHLEDKWTEGSRLCHSKVWLEHDGPGKKGHNPK